MLGTSRDSAVSSLSIRFLLRHVHALFILHRPMNFLAPSHRIIYSLAAGALSATFTNLVLSGISLANDFTTDNYYLGAFLHCELVKN